ncbi:MAG TPA: VWA domain-containing protein [Leptospiraceae bacterium]|jgi:hypothetical protein|nr:VWA domain-containing protein [Leptospirales bacterium]HMU84323.1 VWA domain-containing protein [Leptospiraceae bacterium]HMW59552.1 VWA domain-containing protein [Leptospiraceae bacterium]HMX57217.1 VWA domain-containing protein [Leptospiraceae bacterium]HMY45295.1 VWA domain-containing protein [Leptospiraceae bacterium]
MAILPFASTGANESLAFTEQDLPNLLAGATHFIFESTREHRLQDQAQTEKAVKSSGWTADQPLDSAALRSLCRTTSASRLFAGNAQFLSEGRVAISANVFSCAGLSEIGRGRRSGSLSNLQELLRGLIADAAPFSPEKRTTTAGRRKPADVILVIDASGSMEEDYRAIIKSLPGIREKLPDHSRISAVVVQPEGLDVLPFTESWSKMISVLDAKRPSGEVTIKQVEDGLGVVENFREWKGDRKLLLCFDAKSNRRMNGIESRLRRLTGKGIDISLFQLQGQTPKDQAEIRRLSTMLRLTPPSVAYGRRAGFVEGFSLFLIQYGGRYYRADRDATAEIQSGTLDLSRLAPVETIHYTEEELQLKNLPAAYAKHENLRLVGTGPVISGIEVRVKQAVEVRGEEVASVHRALVKHEGQGLWIRIADDGTANSLKKWKGQKLYAGLSFTREGRELFNDPSRVYLKTQGDVPRLLITTKDNLQRASHVSPEDVHFLLCEVVDVQGPGQGDLRRQEK